MSTSKVLQKKFNERKPKLKHLIYLDNILSNIDPIHFEKVMEIRKTIELTLLDNPESDNKVVAYLSWVNDKIKNISFKRNDLIKRETENLVLV